MLARVQVAGRSSVFDDPLGGGWVPQGYNDVGFQTPNYAVTHTPNLDFLAKGGVVFTNHHVQPFCSPTRAALQTYVPGYCHVRPSGKRRPGCSLLQLAF